MQTIGERLEEARKRKGVSIREAAEATKIRSDYLHKFESNSFDLKLPEIYIAGFLRSYALYLKLPTDKIIAEYGAAAGTAKKPARRERDAREIYGHMELNETTRPPEAGAGGEAAAKTETAPIRSAASRAPVPSSSGLDQATLIKASLLAGGVLLVVLLIVLLVKALGGHSTASSAAAATPSAAVQAEAAQTLNLIGLDSTRVKVVQELDGKVLFNGSITRGETRSFEKQGKLLITVEIGRNLHLEVNGRSYPVPIDGYGRFGVD